MQRTLAILVLAAAPAAHAVEWNPSGELGLVVTNGNSDTASLNAKLALKGEDEDWIHDYHALALRAEVDDEKTANRWELAGKSGWKFGERSYAFGSVRYEDDDFAPYESQATVAVGYGYKAIDTTATQLLLEIGPGYRRAELVDGDTEGDVIARGFLDFKHQMTPSTALFDTLLIEAGGDNTFAQNDFGVQVAMNETLALKAAFQVRHNTDVPVGIESTDTLMTVNVVWSPD